MIKEHDFVEVDYTGKLADGTVFDTTLENVARDNHLHSEKTNYSPAIICIGEKQILPGLDEEIVGKEIGEEYTVTLPPEKAFGKRDIKKMKIVPMGTFRQHNINVQPGLQVDIDGEIGTIARVSGGRVIVNFNHPLSGREVIYTFKINRKIDDNKEKLSSFLSTMMRIPADKLKIEVKENKAEVFLPMDIPAQITSMFAQKLIELTGLKEVTFKKEEKNG
jgi:FKBP-type peptidyl-prolyl cis-trans isomerase 2